MSYTQLISEEISPIESNREQIHSEKPEMSFSQLISEALVNSPNQMLESVDIRKAISLRHPCYRADDKEWQLKVNQTLSSKSQFTRVIDNFGYKCWTFSKTPLESPENNKELNSKKPKEKEQFNCDLCRKKFITKQGFKGHVCYAHFGENHKILKEFEKLFQCKLCNKMFRSKLGLKGHVERVHEGKNQNSDEENNQQTYEENKQQTYEEKQQQTCEEEIIPELLVKPFECKKCNQHFQSEQRLKVHITLAHKEKEPYGVNDEFCNSGRFFERMSWEQSLKARPCPFIQNLS